MSVHIICVKKWPKSVGALIGCDFEDRDDSTVIGIDEKAKYMNVNPTIQKFLPPTFIDGPHGGLSKDIFQFEVAVLVVLGWDVAQFASILKSIWYRMSGFHQKTRLRKVYVFWSCERQFYGACMWFKSLLMAIESQDIDHNIEIFTVSGLVHLPREIAFICSSISTKCLACRRLWGRSRKTTALSKRSSTA